MKCWLNLHNNTQLLLCIWKKITWAYKSKLGSCWETTLEDCLSSQGCLNMSETILVLHRKLGIYLCACTNVGPQQPTQSFFAGTLQLAIPCMLPWSARPILHKKIIIWYLCVLLAHICIDHSIVHKQLRRIGKNSKCFLDLSGLTLHREIIYGRINVP